MVDRNLRSGEGIARRVLMIDWKKFGLKHAEFRTDAIVGAICILTPDLTRSVRMAVTVIRRSSNSKANGQSQSCGLQAEHLSKTLKLLAVAKYAGVDETNWSKGNVDSTSKSYVDCNVA